MVDGAYLRGGLAIIPIVGWLLSNRLCNRLPHIMETGWSGILAAPQARCAFSFARTVPFVAAASVVGLSVHSALPTPAIASLAVMLSTLAFLTATDIEFGVLPDLVIKPVMVLGLIAASAGFSTVNLPGAAMGALFGWLLARSIDRRMRRSGGTFGAGDIKILVLLGTWLGPIAGFSAFVVAMIILCVAVSKFGRVKKYQWIDETAFAPYIFAGTVITVPLYTTYFV